MSAEQLQSPPVDHQARVVIKTDEDYEIDSQLVDQVHAVGNEDSPGSFLTVKLPCNPLFGQSHTLVASGVAINVDGNDNPVAGGLTVVPLNNHVTYIFSVTDASEDCEGVWVPTCCAETPAPIT